MHHTIVLGGVNDQVACLHLTGKFKQRSGVNGNCSGLLVRIALRHHPLKHVPIRGKRKDVAERWPAKANKPSLDWITSYSRRYVDAPSFSHLARFLER